MNRRFLIDAAERVAFTFLEAFAGAIVLAGALDLSTAKAALIAGVTAAAAVVKSLAAKFVGRKDSAAMLPADSPPERQVPVAGPVDPSFIEHAAHVDLSDLAPQVPVTVAAVAKKKPAKKPTKKAGK